MKVFPKKRSLSKEYDGIKRKLISFFQIIFLLEIIKDIKESVVLLAGMNMSILFPSNLPWRAYLIWYPVIFATAVEKMHSHRQFFLSYIIYLE